MISYDSYIYIYIFTYTPVCVHTHNIFSMYNWCKHIHQDVVIHIFRSIPMWISYISHRPRELTALRNASLSCSSKFLGCRGPGALEASRDVRPAGFLVETHDPKWQWLLHNELEHGHRNSGFSHVKWWMSIAVFVYQRVIIESDGIWYLLLS